MKSSPEWIPMRWTVGILLVVVASKSGAQVLGNDMDQRSAGSDRRCELPEARVFLSEAHEDNANGAWPDGRFSQALGLTFSDSAQSQTTFDQQHSTVPAIKTSLQDGLEEYFLTVTDYGVLGIGSHCTKQRGVDFRAMSVRSSGVC